jgi:hypothetical protein
VKIDRNYSFNTILSSVSVDRLDGKPTRNEQYGIPLCEIPYDPPPFPESYSSGNGRKIGLLWQTLDQKYGVRKGMGIQRSLRLSVYRAARELGKDDEEIKKIADSLKWRLNQWDEAQRQEWRQAMKRSHEELQKTVPTLQEAIDLYKEWY